MMDALGWICTILVLLGYINNAKGHCKTAMVMWITGDLGWIVYDIYINNLSHLVLSLVIIAINVYGIYRIIQNNNQCIKR
jgi:hypothetical protein